MTDYVTLPGTAKNVDATEITLPDGATLVDRQRMAIGDGSELEHLASVDASGRLTILMANQEDILLELRRITFLLEEFTGVSARKVR